MHSLRFWEMNLPTRANTIGHARTASAKGRPWQEALWKTTVLERWTHRIRWSRKLRHRRETRRTHGEKGGEICTEVKCSACSPHEKAGHRRGKACWCRREGVLERDKELCEFLCYLTCCMRIVFRSRAG